MGAQMLVDGEWVDLPLVDLEPTVDGSTEEFVQDEPVVMVRVALARPLAWGVLVGPSYDPPGWEFWSERHGFVVLSHEACRAIHRALPLPPARTKWWES